MELNAKNTDILDKLNSIENQLSNQLSLYGRIEQYQFQLNHISDQISTLKTEFDGFKDNMNKKLLDPEYGIIVNVNKNKDNISRIKIKHNDLPDIKNDVENLKDWKSSISKALWVVYTVIIGIIISLVFGDIKK